MRGAALAVAVSIVGAGCAGGVEDGGSSPAQARRVTPERYLAQVLRVVRTRAYYADRLDWPHVEAQAERTAADAVTSADTYPFVEELVRRLDRHSQLVRPVNTETPADPPGRVPTGRRHGNAVAVVSLPGTTAHGSSAPAGRYIAHGRTLTAPGPCGWVLDLREDTGGDLLVMLSAVAPLLPAGVALRYRHRDGRLLSLSVSTSGAVLADKTEVVPAGAHMSRAPTDTRIAVVQGFRTASAGEGVVMAFHGRPTSRSFGFPTAGVPTSRAPFGLADGSSVVLTTAVGIDHAGVSHDDTIDPDERILDPEAATAAAKAWVAAGPRCRR